MQDLKVLKIRSQEDLVSLKKKDSRKVNQLYGRIKEFFLNSFSDFQTKYYSLSLLLQRILDFQDSYNTHLEKITTHKNHQFWSLKKMRLKLTIGFLQNFSRSLILIEKKLLTLRKKLKSQICGVIKKEDFFLCSMDEHSVDEKLFINLEEKKILCRKILKLKQTHSQLNEKMSEIDIKHSLLESLFTSSRRFKAEKLSLNIDNYEKVLLSLNERYSSSIQVQESLNEDEINALREIYHIMRE